MSAVCFMMDQLVNKSGGSKVLRTCTSESGRSVSQTMFVLGTLVSPRLLFVFLKVDLRACPSEGPLFSWIMCKSPEFVIVGESACGASFPLLSSGIFALDSWDISASCRQQAHGWTRRTSQSSQELFSLTRSHSHSSAVTVSCVCVLLIFPVRRVKVKY